MAEIKRLTELKCNVDDMTGEAISFAIERFYELGAHDVYTVAVGMKKSRPGILIHITCAEENKSALIDAIFKYTTTIGVREYPIIAHTLERRIETVDTELGAVRLKISAGHGVERRKPEYEDISNIAKRENLSIDEVLTTVKDHLK